MNLLFDLFSSVTAQRIAWTLVHSLWQFTLLAAVLHGLLVALRRRSAETRYLVACGGLVAMLLTCAATYWSPLAAINASSVAQPVEIAINQVKATNTSNASPLETNQADSSLVHRESVAALPRISANEVSADANESTPLRPTAAILQPLLPWITLAWLAGVLLFSLRQFGGWLGVQTLRRRGLSAAAPNVIDFASRLQQRMEIPWAVRIMQSKRIEVPVVIGWLRPLILLPPSLLVGLSPCQLEAILAHELAHVRRHDYLVNLLQTAIETVLFYHPAVWWLSGRIRAERENCCDDLAIRVCGNPVDYAEALTVVEQSRQTPPLAMAMQGSRPAETIFRVRRILGVADSNPVGSSSAAALLIAVGLAMVLLTGYVTSAAEPSSPEATKFTHEYQLEETTIVAGFQPDESQLILGQPTFVTFTVTNRTGKPYRFMVGGDNRGSVRHNNFHITAVDEEGQAVKDPYNYNHFGGLAQEITLNPGETHTERLFLGHWLAFERPGKYTVTCQRTLEDFGAESGNAKLAIETKFPLEVLPYNQQKMALAIAKFSAQIDQASGEELRQATIALASIDDPAVISPLAQSLQRGDFLNKLPALEGLAKFTNEAASTALVMGLQDGDHVVRRAAADALRQAGKIEQAASFMLTKLADPSPAVRQQAAQALGETQSEAAIAPLTVALNDTESAVRCAAAVSLGRLGGKSEAERLNKLLLDEDRNLRLAAADGLRQMNPDGQLDPAWLTPTIRETTDINDQTFHESLRMIRMYGGEKAAAALIGCLDFNDPSTRNSYNFFLILAIHHCKNGPDCYYRWKHDPNTDGTPDEIANNRKIFAELKAYVAQAPIISPSRLIQLAGIKIANGQTDAAQLTDLFEAVPPGSKSYEIRKEVVPLRSRSQELDSMVYFIPSKNHYYIQRDPLGSSTLTYYGPFPGNPQTILAAADDENDDNAASPQEEANDKTSPQPEAKPDQPAAKPKADTPALVVHPLSLADRPVSLANITLWRALEPDEKDPVNTVNGPQGFGYYNPVIWQDAAHNARWVRAGSAHPNDGRHGWEEKAFHFRSLQPGRYRVTVNTYDRKATTPDPTPYGVSEPFTSDGTTPQEVTVRLIRWDASMTVQAVDAETNQLIPGLALRLRDASGMPIVHGHGSGNYFEETNNEGKVLFARVKSGRFTLQVLGKKASVNQFVQYEPLPTQLDLNVVPGKNEFLISIQPRKLEQAEIDKRFPFSVYGVVTDPSGNPLPGVTVRAATGVGTLLGGGRTVTDKQGKYRLYFTPGMTIVADEKNAPLGVGVQAAQFTTEKPGWKLDAEEGHVFYIMTDQKPEPFTAKGAKVGNKLWGTSTPDLVIFAHQPRELNLKMKPGQDN